MPSYKHWVENQDHEPLDLEALEKRYTAETVPPCIVCGGELSIQRMGGGAATKYAHSSPPGVSARQWGDHYEQSAWVQYRAGDSQVLALIAEVRRLRAEAP